MNYLLVVQAPCARVSDGTFATESAFGEHLRLLRAKLGSRFDRMIVAAPMLTASDYASRKGELAHIDERSEGIEFLELHPVDARAREFWRRDARRVWRSLREAARGSDVVHAGLSDDLFRPIMAMANAAGALERKSVLFIVDIDFRADTERYRKAGLSSLKDYLA
ncbi:MAG: hypothetical protein H5U40_12580, partial [Polyangiaceae bacterium]|nr:hypothetical protein [Polyangiaceae bacterium]